MENGGINLSKFLNIKENHEYINNHNLEILFKISNAIAFLH